MKKLYNDRFLKALKKEPVDRTPVWMMRQAGRYLPEYRETRAKAGGFLDLCKNTDLACEVTMQPLRRYNMDAAILFSDILTIPDALGLGLYFEEGEGPRFSKTIKSDSDLSKLNNFNAKDDLSYVMDAVAAIKSELNSSIPLIGFSGSPWTLATYMVEGGGSKTFSKVKAMMYDSPNLMHDLLSILADAVADYLSSQIRSGADAVQIFDTWGGILGYSEYQTFSLSYMKHIVSKLKSQQDTKDVPVILFTKNGGQWLDVIADSGTDCVGIDWTTDIAVAKSQIGNKVSLQGNMDPAVLYASPKIIRQEVLKILDNYGSCPGHIFNLGHGITPGVHPDNVKAFVDAVVELSPDYHTYNGK